LAKARPTPEALLRQEFIQARSDFGDSLSGISESVAAMRGELAQLTGLVESVRSVAEATRQDTGSILESVGTVALAMPTLRADAANAHQHASALRAELGEVRQVIMATPPPEMPPDPFVMVGRLDLTPDEYELLRRMKHNALVIDAGATA
jgi:hypothetical protein